MSSLATAPSHYGPATGARGLRIAAIREHVSGDAALGLVLAGALALESFVTTGGVDLAPNTWAEIVLTFIGAGLCVAAVIVGPGGRLWGAGALTLLAALSALTIASVSWSVQPANSWVEANRSLSYLAAFAGGLALARLTPARWRALIGALAVLATFVSGYALLVKVFPGTLDPGEILGRLRAPFDYWNAVGLMAALGLPACLWAGARREHRPATRALAVPAVGVLLVTLMLSYSRGALLAAVIGLGVWFWTVPLRLRAALVLGLGALGAAPVTVWALATHPITRDLASLPSRTTAGHAFGLALVVMIVLQTGAGFVTAFAIDRSRVRGELRRRIGVGLIGLMACVPLVGFVALATSSRGLAGEISHDWQALTDPNQGVGDTAGRLVQVSNSRARYWREGFDVGSHALFKGVGALGFGTARTRFSSDSRVAEHAHSYAVETFADLGLLGLLVSLALLVAWGVAAARSLAIPPPRRLAWLRGRKAVPDRAPRPIRELADERIGLLTLMAVVVIFGVHSAIDWTWFVPGVAVPALVCAGWLAGRGPLAAAPTRLRPRDIRRDPIRLPAVAALTALAVIGAWMIWQPLRAADADASALASLAAGNSAQALAQAQNAVHRNPVAVEPLWDLATVYNAVGSQRSAHAALVRAVMLQPANSETWRQLGVFDLHAGRRREAVRALRQSLVLDPHSPLTQTALVQAQSELSRGASGR